MKTKNIFRMFLVAALLLMGVNSVKAGEREVEFQGNYNYQYDNFVAANTEFSDMAEGSVFRIYVSNINANGWKLYICGGVSSWNSISWVDPGFENWNKVDISWYTWSDNSQGYSFNNEYFEFVCTATTVSVFQTHGLFIDTDGMYTIDRITYTTDAATVEKFAVNLPSNLTGGTVTASPSRQEEGKTVTLTLTPSAGYEVGTVSVVDAANNSVTLGGSGNTRTFTMPGRAVTVSATFNVIDYTVTAGDGVSVSSTTAHIGETITITPGNPPAGYELVGVTVKDANNQSVQVNNNQFVMPASNVTVSAVFKIVVSSTTTVTSIWGPSSKAIDWWDNRIEYSTANFANAKVGDIIRIKGSMNSENNYFNVQLNDMQVPNWGNTALTAQWTSAEDGYIDAVISQDMLNQLKNNQSRNLTGYNFTVTDIQWLHNDGEIVVTPTHTLTISVDGTSTTQSVAEGASLSDILPTPSKEGYTFSGWTGMPTDGKMPQTDLTVTAVFTVNSYTLTYMVDGEVYGTPETVAYGTAITPKAEPTKEGFTFSGWQNVPATMPAQDVVITGSFDKDKVYTSVAVGASGYATFCSTKALYFTGNEAVKAYIAKFKNGNNVTLQQVIGNIAAGTGLVLKGSANASASVEEVESGTAYSNNLLVGVTSGSVTINAANKYVLVVKNGVVKFADTYGREATVPAGKSYLQVSASARELTFDFEDDTTPIEATANDKEADGVIYNLRGVRVDNPGKGLYIVNGKKVFIK